jgi:dTDP-D-glucose 4,6-dehydratase
VSFEQGLKETIDWYVETHDVSNVKEKLDGLLTSR